MSPGVSVVIPVRNEAPYIARNLEAVLAQDYPPECLEILVADGNVAAAAEALRVEQDRYRLGAGTLLDLLTAQANLTEAQVTQVQARYDYLNARAQLEALVGHSL